MIEFRQDVISDEVEQARTALQFTKDIAGAAGAIEMNAGSSAGYTTPLFIRCDNANVLFAFCVYYGQLIERYRNKKSL